MTSITAAGTGSGLDIETIIETLTEAESLPAETRLNTREIEVKADISAYASLKAALEDFQKAMSGLSNLKELAARAATSSNSDTFTATATSGAAVGSSTIQVTQLASNHKIVSNVSFSGPDAAVAAGKLTIGLGSDSFEVDIVGGQNNTLAGIRDAINDAADNPGITASILTISDGAGGTLSKLVLTADESGDGKNITVTASGDSDGSDVDDNGLSAFNFTDENNGNMIQKSKAQDAKMLVDGFLVASSTNVFENAIQGVTINALAAAPGEDETLTIALDKSAISERMNTFVSAFNVLSDTLDFLTDYDVETQEAGLLTGDFATRTIETQIRRTLSSAIDGNGAFTSLAAIGVTTQRDGSLALDSTKFNSALNSNFDDVADMLAGDNGIVKSLDDRLESFLRSDGVIASRNSTFQTQLKDISDQREQLALRMESFEARLRLQYTNLDILVGQLQSTGDFVTQQLDIIKAGITGKKSS